MEDIDKFLGLMEDIDPIFKEVEPHVVSTVNDGFECKCEVCDSQREWVNE